MIEFQTELNKHLRELHLPTFRECYQDEADLARQESLTHEHYLLELAKRECEERTSKRTVRYMRESKLPLEKSIDVFDKKRLPGKLNSLVDLLLEGSFVDRNENVLAFGNPGSGKTHLLDEAAPRQTKNKNSVELRYLPNSAHLKRSMS